MAKMNYIKGDATQPIGNGNKHIIHICNDIGKWGKGFVLALSKKWYAPEERYMMWRNSHQNFYRGNIQKIKVEDDVFVINMIAEDGIHFKNGKPPIRYDALEECLNKVVKELEKTNDNSIHMPRIGCGLAGGKWDIVESIIQKTLIKAGIEVYIYDLEV